MTINDFYIVSHIKLDCYYNKNFIKENIKKRFVLIIWREHADVGLSHVLFWLHPPKNDCILVTPP